MTDTHPAHARIAKANQITLAALVEFAASRPEPRRPAHPETGCWCTPCTERDDWLESQAEARAEERRGDHDSERTRRDMADYRAEMDNDYWSGS